MNLFILRHAIAVQRGVGSYPQDDRPLTEAGIEKMERAAQGILKIIPKLDMILTSPMKRASQTAEIVARTLRCSDRVTVTESLLPGMTFPGVVATLRKYQSAMDVMIVGHEPDLSHFVSSLTGAREVMIEFKKGSLCCLDVTLMARAARGIILWHLTPKHLRLIAKNS